MARIGWVENCTSGQSFDESGAYQPRLTHPITRLGKSNICRTCPSSAAAHRSQDATRFGRRLTSRRIEKQAQQLTALPCGVTSVESRENAGVTDSNASVT